eukprot:m.83278 g.83278  ORF g.83278 m.83278 type:complete len:324 (-) comp11184_c0_seq1:1036-2007(-)
METEREVHRARRWRSTLKVGDGASAPTAPRCEAGPLRAASERAAEGGGVLKRLVGGVAVGAGAVVVAERAVPTCGEQVGPKEHDGRGAAEPGAPTRSERARAAGVGAEARSPARVREPRAATSLDRVAVPGDEVLKVGAEDGERSDPVKRGRARWEQHRVCGAVARGVSKGRGGLSRAAVRRHRRRGLHPNHAVGVARADADGVGRRVVDPGGLGGVAAGVVRKSRAGLHGSPRDAVLRDGGALEAKKQPPGKNGACVRVWVDAPASRKRQRRCCTRLRPLCCRGATGRRGPSTAAGEGPSAPRPRGRSSGSCLRRPGGIQSN